VRGGKFKASHIRPLFKAFSNLPTCYSLTLGVIFPLLEHEAYTFKLTILRIQPKGHTVDAGYRLLFEIYYPGSHFM
jgi:hypothetical protein